MSVAAASGAAPFAWDRQVVEAGPVALSGNKRCNICFTDPSVDLIVSFMPCKHEACATCMADLRKDAIRKVCVKCSS
jgi:Zinc finger, C3HC4 type (RING finger)